jgi:hypothetical protein
LRSWCKKQYPQKGGSFPFDRASYPDRKRGFWKTAILAGFILIKTAIFENEEIYAIFFMSVDALLRS